MARILIAFLALAGLFMPPWRTGADVLASPSLAHPLGTNAIGQDMLAGIISAAPDTVIMAIVAAFGATVIGCALAFVAQAQSAVLRLVDVMLAVPQILILMFVASITQPGPIGLALLLAATSWQEDVRILHAVLSRESRRDSLFQARQMGAGRGYLLRRHLLPALRPALMAVMIQNTRQVALRAAGLAFLGLTDPRRPSWGSMMQDASDQLYSGAWLWLLLPPVAALALFLLAFTERPKPC